VLRPVVRARLGVDVVGPADADAELHVLGRLPHDVVLGVDRPADRVGVAGRQPGHVAREVGEALAAAFEHVGRELADERLGLVRRGRALLGQVNLALDRVVDLELERLARCGDGGCVGALKKKLICVSFFCSRGSQKKEEKNSHLSARKATENTALRSILNTPRW